MHQAVNSLQYLCYLGRKQWRADVLCTYSGFGGRSTVSVVRRGNRRWTVPPVSNRFVDGRSVHRRSYGRVFTLLGGVVYDGGINLFVVGTEGHGWWLGFTSPNWSLTPSASIPVKMQFDGRAPAEVLGTIVNGQLLLVPAPD
jgi:hypothetical protein